MQLIKNLLFVLILIISIIFINNLEEENNADFIRQTYLRTSDAKKELPNKYDKQFLKSNKTIDQVMIKIPFSNKDSHGLKVWVFFLAILTIGIVVGFLMALIRMFAIKRESMAYKNKVKKLQLELDTLRNQSIDEDLVLKDNLDDKNKKNDLMID